MITREDLKQTKMQFAMHLDGSGFFQNHYVNTRWPRLTCIVTNPRGRNSKAVFSKRFYVDGVEVTGCRELLERLNAQQLVAIDGGKAA
jgi:hypothetical protein